MGISYRKLFLLLEKRGLKKFDLRKIGFSPTIIDRLVKDRGVNISTIAKLCEVFNCQPGDLMEYISENTWVSDTGETVQAIQWTGDLAAARRFHPRIWRTTMAIRDGEVFVNNAGSALLEPTRSDEAMIVMRDDYIVKDSDGAVYTLPRLTFESMYKKVE